MGCHALWECCYTIHDWKSLGLGEGEARSPRNKFLKTFHLLQNLGCLQGRTGFVEQLEMQPKPLIPILDYHHCSCCYDALDEAAHFDGSQEKLAMKGRQCWSYGNLGGGNSWKIHHERWMMIQSMTASSWRLEPCRHCMFKVTWQYLTLFATAHKKRRKGVRSRSNFQVKLWECHSRGEITTF